MVSHLSSMQKQPIQLGINLCFLQTVPDILDGETVNSHNLGNIAYGYLGTCMGMSPQTLFAGGGFAKKYYCPIKIVDYSAQPNYNPWETEIIILK